MTYRLLDALADCDLAPLLAPANIIPAADILRDKFVIPDVGGVYGWWFDAELPGVPLEGTLAINCHRLHYVGIAPRKPSASGNASKSTLRKRIRRHHLGRRIGSSTLRRSLACLLRDQLSLTITKSGPGCKANMPREHENLLTDWMLSHAAVSILPHSGPWDIEEHLIALGQPALPLNLRGATHDFVALLRALRSRR